MREARSVSCWTQKILGRLNSRQEAQEQRRFVQGCRVLSALCWSTMPPPLSARFCPCGHIPDTPIEGCGLHTLEEVLRSLLLFACFSSIDIPFCIRHVSWSVVKHNSRILAEPGWLWVDPKAATVWRSQKIQRKNLNYHEENQKMIGWRDSLNENKLVEQISILWIKKILDFEISSGIPAPAIPLKIFFIEL